jgi:eukaryotic-like serine/threonine-protein kinase
MAASSSSPRSVRDPLIGALLHDRYRVERLIGKGGMGLVYLAEHVRLRRKVALKTLNARAFASEELVARFQREAMAAAAIGNEHVVGVTDMGQLDDGSFFVVLEYLEGVELAHAVEGQGPFSVSRAVDVLDQLCVALGAVHEAGIVHRDLKPENLFLVERGGKRDFVKVLDFGVCKIQSDWQSGERALTRTGQSIGTPQYMAPEQIENSAQVDVRADIYAAGAILYYALTGQAPYNDVTLPRLLMRICSEPPPPVRMTRPGLPVELERVIARAMERSPQDRYQSAAELRAALRPFAGDDPAIAARAVVAAPACARVERERDGARSPTTASAASLAEVALRAQRSRRTHVLLGGIALVLSVLLLSAVGQSWRAQAPAPSATRDGSRAAQPSRTPSLAPAPAEATPSIAAPQVEAAAPRRTPRARLSRQPTPTPTPPSTGSTPDAPAATAPEPAAAPQTATDSARSYRLSQRGLEDVFLP